MTKKNVFLSIYGFLSISHIKRCRNQIISKDVEKLRNCCYNLCVHSPFHIDAQVLTSHFRKMVELWCFGCDSIAISEAHITFWIFLLLLTVILLEPIREIRRSENCVVKKMGCKNCLASHPTPVSFFITFFRELPSPFVNEVLFELPLGSAFRTLSNTCQTRIPST